MEHIEKALQELEKAIEEIDALARVTISITLKPKPSKDKPDK